MRLATLLRIRPLPETRFAPPTERPRRRTDRSALILSGRYLAYTLAATALLFLLPALARTGGAKALDEDGAVEWFQWGAIIAAAVLFFGGAIRYPGHRALLVALGIFAMVAVIREQNNSLAAALPGYGWIAIAGPIVLIGLVWLWGRRRELSQQVGQFVFTVPFVLLAGGLFVVVAFAQLVSAREIWQSVLEDGFRRQLTRAIQETVEAFGYTLLLIAAIETLLYVGHRTARHGLEPVIA